MIHLKLRAKAPRLKVGSCMRQFFPYLCQLPSIFQFWDFLSNKNLTGSFISVDRQWLDGDGTNCKADGNILRKCAWTHCLFERFIE